MAEREHRGGKAIAVLIDEALGVTSEIATEGHG